MYIQNIISSIKTIKKPLLWGGLVGLLFCTAACSNIAEDERLIYVAPATANRAVLIEDFTGQRCVNCPKATEAIHELQTIYGEDVVIPVAIHCGPFGFTGSKKYEGFKTDTTQEYWDAWFDSTQGQPVAKINRGAANDDYTNWSAVVATEMQKTTTVSIAININYDEATRKATLVSTLNGTKGSTEKYQLWLTEDSIIGMQAQPDGSILYDYVHNHVLRDVVNGTWGEQVTFGETPLTLNNEITLDEKYKAENCHIVAFVYGDGGVEQVINVPVITK